MRNLITRAVFDKTFKAGEKFSEPDLELIAATFLYADSAGSTSWTRRPSRRSRSSPT